MSTPLREKIRALRTELDKVVSGYDEIKDMVIVCLLADGHILLEAVPGTAKTTLVSTLQKAIAGAKSGRIQLTPDVKPVDIIGVEIYNQAEATYFTRTGPMIGANIFLADEINRTTPKTLSATLQAMQERTVTIGDTTYSLEELFILLATMNPVEQEGTYDVPEATLDRFMMKLVMEYVSRDHELEMLRNTVVHGRYAQTNVEGAITVDEMLAARKLALALAEKATEPVLQYITDLTRATRPQDERFDSLHGEKAALLRQQILLGASPRCLISTLHAAAALAFVEGSSYITADHVKRVFPNVARHRILLTDAAKHKGVTTDSVIAEVLERVEVVRPGRRSR